MYKLFSASLLIGLLFSCTSKNDGAFTIGDDFVKTETNVAILDTFTVRLSTFMLDSFPTSGTGVGLFGNYTDPEMGIVKAKNYFQIGISGDYVADSRDKFDSLTVTMKYTGRYYGDTTKLQKINVYRLTQELRQGESKSFYNTTTFAHENTPIGSISIKPEPLNHKKLEIRMSDKWGQELFEKIKSNSTDLDKEEDFLKYFKGFAIDSETNDGAMLSIGMGDTLFYMTVYSHRFDNDLIATKHVFPFINSNLQFNHIESDRSGTPSALITSNSRNDVPAILTGDQSYSQGGTGIFTRIEFPGLGRLLEMNQNRFLRKAELILHPSYKSYEKIALPKQLFLYESDKNNTVLSPISDNEGKPKESLPVIDDIYFEDTYYKFDITTFIASELADGIFDVNHALLVNISTSSLPTTAERVVFSNSPKAKYKPTLKLYYAFYK